MKKMINFLNKNKYIIFIFILYLLFFIQMQSVEMYADDYNTFKYIDSLSDKMQHMVDILLNYWSGRIIGHTIVVGGLTLFGIGFFRVLQPLFVFLFCFVFSKILNIKIKTDIKKLIFFVSLFIMGFSVGVNSELIYWTYSSILYFWGYIPMLIILYFVLDCHANDKKFSNFRFVVSIIFLIIVNFMMESTMIFICVFLFLIILKKGIKKVDKRIFILFTITVALLFFTVFIPGNIVRLKIEQANSTFLSFFSNKIPSYFNFIIYVEGVSNIVTLASIIICIKNLSRKKDIIPIAIVLILNIVFFINFRVFDFMKFYGQPYKLYIYILIIIYTTLNIYLLFKLKDIDISYMLLIITGIITTFINIILVNYISTRFYFLLIIPLEIFILKTYLTENNKNRCYILITYIFLLNHITGIICLILYFILFNRKNKVYLFLIVLILFNLFNFMQTSYCYYQNSLIFDYNVAAIEKAKQDDVGVVYLKKLKYRDYAYQLPDYNSYVMPWYKEYHQIETFKVIYEEPS